MVYSLILDMFDRLPHPVEPETISNIEHPHICGSVNDYENICVKVCCGRFQPYKMHN